MIVGLQMNFCIEVTVKSGFEHGLQMIVPEYANSTFDNDYMKKDVCYRYYNDYLWPARYVECISMLNCFLSLCIFSFLYNFYHLRRCNNKIPNRIMFLIPRY